MGVLLRMDGKRRSTSLVRLRPDPPALRKRKNEYREIEDLGLSFSGCLNSCLWSRNLFDRPISDMCITRLMFILLLSQCGIRWYLFCFVAMGLWIFSIIRVE
jgi:hypothetical protein